MSKFRIGDKIRVVKSFGDWLDQGSERDQIFTVVEDNNNPNHVFCPETNTCDIEYISEWPYDFEIVNTRFSVDLAPEAALNYATGGLVSDDTSVISAHDGSWSIGKLGQVNIGNGVFGSGLDREVVTSLVLNDTKPFEFTTDLTSDGKTYISGLGVGIATPNFTTLPHPLPGAIGIPPQEVVTLPAKPELGVYRPNLEDRKVGKVRVELVDDGFPLALREIAKVMTWAQTAKGYKDHDWLNLPNPEQALSAAASRHRTDAIIQRQVGKSAAVDCTDHESKLLHKAHEAFGVLAQLELILRGVIK